MAPASEHRTGKQARTVICHRYRFAQQYQRERLTILAGIGRYALVLAPSALLRRKFSAPHAVYTLFFVVGGESVVFRLERQRGGRQVRRFEVSGQRVVAGYGGRADDGQVLERRGEGVV